MFGGDEDENYDGNEADLIPGDNSLPGEMQRPQTPGQPLDPNVKENLSAIPADPGGEVPIVVPPKP